MVVNLLITVHLSEKVQWKFFHAVAVLVLLYSGTTWTLTKHLVGKIDGNYTVCCLEQILKAIFYKAATV